VSARLGVDELTMHYRPLPGPSAPIACGVTHGCVTAVLDDVTCVYCKTLAAGGSVHEPVAVDAIAAARRLEARGAFWDALGAPPVQINGRGGVSDALDEAVETAARVRVDALLVADVRTETETSIDAHEARRVIVAAFRAAGFEVEQ
jgi:hypothetical protein